MQFVRECMGVASMRGFSCNLMRECMRVASNERFLHAIEYVNESVTDGLRNELQFISTKSQRCCIYMISEALSFMTSVRV